MSVAAVANERVRWRMGVDARALVIVTAALLAFGLAVLYSASAYEAMRAGRPSAYFLLRQVAGVGAGAFLFMVCAKIDAERWKQWAWPLIVLAIATMIATILPGMSATYGSKLFLFG